MKTIRLPKLPRPAPDELRVLLAAADTDAEDPIRARAILLCLLDTGYRLGKFAQLRRCDVDLDTGAITLRHETTKTNMQDI